MIHRWAQGTDGNGATVRATLYDYRKAFDLIDHDILVRKLTVLDIPKQIINWIIDFLSGCSSELNLRRVVFPSGSQFHRASHKEQSLPISRHGEVELIDRVLTFRRRLSIIIVLCMGSLHEVKIMLC